MNEKMKIIQIFIKWCRQKFLLSWLKVTDNRKPHCYHQVSGSKALLTYSQKSYFILNKTDERKKNLID